MFKKLVAFVATPYNSYRRYRRTKKLMAEASAYANLFLYGPHGGTLTWDDWVNCLIGFYSGGHSTKCDVLRDARVLSIAIEKEDTGFLHEWVDIKVQLPGGGNPVHYVLERVQPKTHKLPESPLPTNVDPTTPEQSDDPGSSSPPRSNSPVESDDLEPQRRRRKLNLVLQGSKSSSRDRRVSALDGISYGKSHRKGGRVRLHEFKEGEFVTLSDVVLIAREVSRELPVYHFTRANCYWFAWSLYTAVLMKFTPMGASQIKDAENDLITKGGVIDGSGGFTPEEEQEMYRKASSKGKNTPTISFKLVEEQRPKVFDRFDVEKAKLVEQIVAIEEKKKQADRELEQTKRDAAAKHEAEAKAREADAKAQKAAAEVMAERRAKEEAAAEAMAERRAKEEAAAEAMAERKARQETEARMAALEALLAQQGLSLNQAQSTPVAAHA